MDEMTLIEDDFFDSGEWDPEEGGGVGTFCGLFRVPSFIFLPAPACQEPDPFIPDGRRLSSRAVASSGDIKGLVRTIRFGWGSLWAGGDFTVDGSPGTLAMLSISAKGAPSWVVLGCTVQPVLVLAVAEAQGVLFVGGVGGLQACSTISKGTHGADINGVSVCTLSRMMGVIVCA